MNGKIQKENTTLRTILASIIIALIGIAIMYIGYNMDSKNIIARQIFINIGSVLIVSIALAFLWNLAVRRSFIKEMQEEWITSAKNSFFQDLNKEFKINEQVRKSGIIGFSRNFHDCVNWEDHFNNAVSCELFFSYAENWRHSHQTAIMEMAQRQNVAIKIYLPNPDNTKIMEELARRYSNPVDKIKQKITEAVEEYALWFKGKNAKMSIYFVDVSPLFTFYRFDSTVIIPFHKHAPGRGSVPVIIANKNGDMYDFILTEADYMKNSASKTIEVNI